MPTNTSSATSPTRTATPANRISIIDTRRLVHRVIGGQEGFPALAFPHNPKATDIVIRHTRVFIQHAAALTHAQRVHYIRKLGHYLIRRGLSDQIEFDIVRGSLWFHQHLSQLTGPISFGGAIRLQQRASATATNLKRRRSTAQLHRDLAAPVPDKPIMLAFDSYSLEKCIHPQHVIDTGLTANNCLVVQDIDGSFPNTNYWFPIRERTGHLFTISLASRLVCVLFIKHNVLLEMQSVAFPSTFSLVMPRVAFAIESHIGPVTPLHHGFLWPARSTTATNRPADPDQLTFFTGDDA